jgi:carbon-monoxide dehydrogenase medium subunit
MYDFDYVRPLSLADAGSLLEANSRAQLLGGGIGLIPALKKRRVKPSILVDLAGIAELRSITRDEATVVIGAMGRHADVAASAVVTAHLPSLARLAGAIGDPHVRNRGTIGGSISTADPAADYPAALVGLGATIVTTRRWIPGEDFFIDRFRTALEPGEIVVAVRFPIAGKAAYMKFPNPASRAAIVGVFVAKTGGDVRVAVTGAAGRAFRVPEMESALMRRFTPDVLDGIEISPKDLNFDAHAAADYRAHLIGVMARRAVAACL